MWRGDYYDRGRGLLCAAFLALGLAARGEVTAEPEDDTTQPVLAVQQRHHDAIYSADSSRDGSLVLTGSIDGSVRLWEARTGREVRRFTIPGYRARRRGALLSPAGDAVLILAPDGAARLIDVDSGVETRRFENAREMAAAFLNDGARVAFASEEGPRFWERDARQPRVQKLASGTLRTLASSADGRWLFTGNSEGIVQRWAADGRKRARDGSGKASSGGGVRALAPSADGSVVAILDEDSMIRIADAQTWVQRHPKALRPRPESQGSDAVLDIALAADASQFLIGCNDGSIELWDAKQGTRLRRWEGVTSGAVHTVSFAPGETAALIAGDSGDARLIDLASGNELQRFVSDIAEVTDATVSLDGRTLAVRDRESDQAVVVWNLTTGSAIRHARANKTACLALSPDGECVLTGDEDGVARLWRRGSGKLMRELRGHERAVSAVSFTPDGRHVFTAAGPVPVRMWDLASASEVARLEAQRGSVQHMEVSRNGTHLAVSSTWETVVYDLRTHRPVARIEASTTLTHAALSPDGKWVCVPGSNRRIDLYRVSSSRLTRSFPKKRERRELQHSHGIRAFEFSPDGKTLATCSDDHTIRLWAVATARSLGVVGKHDAGVRSVSFFPDGQRLVSAGADMTTRIWRVEEPNDWLVLTSAYDGRWCVFDAAGKFDASDTNQISFVTWIRGLRGRPLTNLEVNYREPALLARHLAWIEEEPSMPNIIEVPLPAPSVTVRRVPGALGKFEIKASNEGGGIGVVEVFLNGKRVLDDARGGTVESGGTSLHEIDLGSAPQLLPGEKNLIEVRAWNADGDARGGGFRVPFQAPGEEQQDRALWAVVCGVSDYEEDSLDLRFAAKDAEQFGKALRIASEAGYGPTDTHIALLTSPPGPSSKAATKANLLAALRAAKQCRPGDIFVVFLAGHGVSEHHGQAGYHYLLSDVTTEAGAEDAGQGVLSSDELVDLILDVPATKRQFLVLDTCAAGQMRSDVWQFHGASRLLNRVRDLTGMFILAGCAADEKSYESPLLGQGLLTHALLHGFACGSSFREGELVGVRGLMRDAQDHVDVLRKHVPGATSQRPIANQGNHPFDLGRLEPEDRRQIPHTALRPMVIRSSFQQSTGPPIDSRRLTAGVDAALERIHREAGRGSSYFFVDTYLMAGTYRIAGRYPANGTSGSVFVSLLYADRDTGTESEVDEFELEITSRDQVRSGALAEAIVKETTGRITAHHESR